MEMFKTIIAMEAPKDEHYPDGILNLTKGNLQNEASQKAGWRGNVELLNQEREAMLAAMEEAGVPVLVLPTPDRNYKNQFNVRDAVNYIRDTMICNKEGNALVFNMGEGSRHAERPVTEAFLEAMTVPAVPSQRGHNEGGNSRILYRADGPWMFASTSVRSNSEGLDEEAEFLRVPQNQRLTMNVEKGFHFDCGLMVLVDASGRFHAAVHRNSFDAASNHLLDAFARDHDMVLHEATNHDEDQMALNQLFTHGKLFRSAPFSDLNVEAAWNSIPGVPVWTTPLTENKHTGGQVHCLTQEIYTPDPISIEEVNKYLETKPDMFAGALARRLKN